MLEARGFFSALPPRYLLKSSKGLQIGTRLAGGPDGFSETLKLIKSLRLSLPPSSLNVNAGQVNKRTWSASKTCNFTVVERPAAEVKLTWSS